MRPDYLVTAADAAAYVARLTRKPCAEGTIRSAATRGHIGRHGRRGKRTLYDLREIHRWVTGEDPEVAPSVRLDVTCTDKVPTRRPTPKEPPMMTSCDPDEPCIHDPNVATWGHTRPDDPPRWERQAQTDHWHEGDRCPDCPTDAAE